MLHENLVRALKLFKIQGVPLSSLRIEGPKVFEGIRPFELSIEHPWWYSRKLLHVDIGVIDPNG